jgi:hypothetical protein
MHHITFNNNIIMVTKLFKNKCQINANFHLSNKNF